MHEGEWSLSCIAAATVGVEVPQYKPCYTVPVIPQEKLRLIMTLNTGLHGCPQVKIIFVVIFSPQEEQLLPISPAHKDACLDIFT